jgi:hypothetical protein
MSLLTWDNCALCAALICVAMRVLDHPRAAGVASSLALLCATLGQWSAHRRLAATGADPPALSGAQLNGADRRLGVEANGHPGR